MPVAFAAAMHLVIPESGVGWATLVAALAFGAAGSLHCFVMCGPLACAAQLEGGHAFRRALVYHLARILSYAAVGALAGGLGGIVRAELSLPLTRALPWLLAAVLVASVVDAGGRLSKRLPPLPGIAQIVRLVAVVRARVSPIARAALLGAVTPLLPCGLVYGMVASAVVTGSVVGGALLMAAFASGAVPALVAAQLQRVWLARMPRTVEVAVRRGLPLAAAALIVYRAVATAHGHSCH